MRRGTSVSHNQNSRCHNHDINGSLVGMSTKRIGIETLLATGDQLKTARALAGVDEEEVADCAGVNVNTIRNMEARGAKPITSSAVTVRRVQLALEVLGIEFLNHAQPGVRLRIPGERRRNGGRGAAQVVRGKTAKATRTKRWVSGAGTWADEQSDAPSRPEGVRRAVYLAPAGKGEQRRALG